MTIINAIRFETLCHINDDDHRLNELLAKPVPANCSTNSNWQTKFTRFGVLRSAAPIELIFMVISLGRNESDGHTNHILSRRGR